MKIVVAIDSFKGSLTSIESGKIIQSSITDIIPEAEVVVKPLADGGEGTVDALIMGMNGKRYSVRVTGPMGEPVTAYYGVVKGTTAVMEMAMAAGITLVSEEFRNPLQAGTYGVGEMICDAIHRGCRDFIIGIGGSATNDGGLGMLQALGFHFLDKDGNEVPSVAAGLARINTIDTSNAIPQLAECTFRIACDVNNPLCGELGASKIFGAQKGADDEMMKVLDSSLEHFAQVTSKHIGADVSKKAGAGAAGGLGYAFLAYLNGTLESGIAIVLQTIALEKEVMDADFVVTGEGRLDAQTVMGKAPIGVARLAKKYGCTVIAFAGCAAPGAEICNEHGIDAYFPILQSVCTLEQALDKQIAGNNLAAATKQVFRLIQKQNHFAASAPISVSRPATSL